MTHGFATSLWTNVMMDARKKKKKKRKNEFLQQGKKGKFKRIV